MKRVLVVVLAALGAACGEAGEAAEDVAAEVGAETAPVLRATASLIDTEGRSVGEVVLEERAGGVRAMVHVTGFAPGVHAIHLHQVGTCTPPDFMSTGGHFNPEGRQHGLENPEGPHAGDMLNIEVGESGEGHFELENERVTLSPGPNSIFDADGASVVIHAGPDDYRTGPTGEGGMARIACGVFEQ